MESNLREIISDRGLTVTDLSNVTGVARETISHIVNGTRDGNISTLVTIADYLEVSLDVLVGREMYGYKNNRYYQ